MLFVAFVKVEHSQYITAVNSYSVVSIKRTGCNKQTKQEKNNTKTLVQSNSYMVPSIDSLFTHNIHLKIKELWVKRQKIVI